MDITKVQAEEIAKRAIGFCKDIIANSEGEADLQQWASEIQRDLGMLGMAIKFRLEKDEEYRAGYKLLVEETVRLHMTIDTLAEKYTEIMKHAQELEQENQSLSNILEKVKEV